MPDEKPGKTPRFAETLRADEVLSPLIERAIEEHKLDAFSAGNVLFSKAAIQLLEDMPRREVEAWMLRTLGKIASEMGRGYDDEVKH